MCEAWLYDTPWTMGDRRHDNGPSVKAPAGGSSEPVIRVENLVKTYRRRKSRGFWKDLFAPAWEEVPALQGISFTIHKGEFVGYIGLNGAGKTTTLKILSGVLYPTSGTVQVLGHTPWKREAAFLRRIGFVMGSRKQLWWDLPPRDSLALLKEIYAIPDKAFRRRRDELAERLRVKDLLDVPLRNLSLGERMKVELIAALIHDPDLVFLDEPTIGLDILAQQSIRGFLRTYNQDHQKTFLLTTHILSDVEALCSRVILIHHGRILYDGALMDLLRPFQNLRVLRARLRINGQVRDVRLEIPRENVRSQVDAWVREGILMEVREEDPGLDVILPRLFQEAGDAL